jgi:ribulose-phosphate 3-epimerase
MVPVLNESPSEPLEAAFSLAKPALRVVPSLLAADFARLGEHVSVVERAGAEVLHLDVMDGHFVPNISFGPGVIAALRERTNMFFDAHLMITEPLRYAAAFAQAGCDLICFHVETTDTPGSVIGEIRRLGRGVGVALNPTTELPAVEPILPDVDLVLVMSVWPGFGGQRFMDEVLTKVSRLREFLAPHQRLEIDGGIDPETIGRAVRAGADTLVAGTSVFGQSDPAAAWRLLCQRARDASDADT